MGIGQVELLTSSSPPKASGTEDRASAPDFFSLLTTVATQVGRAGHVSSNPPGAECPGTEGAGGAASLGPSAADDVEQLVSGDSFSGVRTGEGGGATSPISAPARKKTLDASEAALLGTPQPVAVTPPEGRFLGAVAPTGATPGAEANGGATRAPKLAALAPRAGALERRLGLAPGGTAVPREESDPSNADRDTPGAGAGAVETKRPTLPAGAVLEEKREVPASNEPEISTSPRAANAGRIPRTEDAAGTAPPGKDNLPPLASPGGPEEPVVTGALAGPTGAREKTAADGGVSGLSGDSGKRGGREASPTESPKIEPLGGGRIQRHTAVETAPKTGEGSHQKEGAQGGGDSQRSEASVLTERSTLVGEKAKAPAEHVASAPREEPIPSAVPAEVAGTGRALGAPSSDASGTARLSATEPGRPDGTADARPHGSAASTPVEQVSKAIRLSMSPRGDRVTVQLEPEHLGRVEVVLTREPQGLVANFRVETPTAQGALTAEAATLRRDLEAQGIPLVRVSVELESQTPDRRSPREDRRMTRRSATASVEDERTRVERGTPWRASAFETTA